MLHGYYIVFIETHLLHIESLSRIRGILTVSYHIRQVYKSKSPGSSPEPGWLYHQM